MAKNYWEERVLADERRATEIAQSASDELAKMYRAQYLRVVKEIEKLKGEIDYGQELTRTQLWNYARWRKVEESLRDCVAESTRIGTDVIHEALEKEFERVIGDKVMNYGGAIGRNGLMALTQLEKNRILSGTWSGDHYSARIWKNTSAIADRMRNEITNMLVDGKSTQDIRRAVMREFGVGYHNADRLVRTEVSYVHNQMTLARYKGNGDALVKILNVEDGKACEVCRELPGKPYDINAAPFLPAHPRCRCCYAPWTYSDRKKWAEEHPERRVDQESTRSAKADFDGSNRRFEAPNREGEKKEPLLGVVNATPEGSGDLAFKIRPTENALQTLPRDGILEESGTKAGGDGVQALCKIENQIYRCITGDLLTDEVIITNKQAIHSNDRHIDAYSKYGDNIVKVLKNPQRIFEDKDHKNTGLVVGELNEDDQYLLIILRLRIPEDPTNYKNSVISCWDITEERLEQYIRNRKTLYKRPGT